MGYYPNMDWPPLLLPSQSTRLTLSYSDRFNFPLTLDELWYWQVFSTHSKTTLSRWSYRTDGYYHLKNRSSLTKIRTSRIRPSMQKLSKLINLKYLFKHVPTIRGVFVTGALSMQNSPPNDDIDIMLVVSPHTLWITRAIIVFLLLLSGHRRPPSITEHSSSLVKDKICDNLYLDLKHLHINHLPINSSPINQSTNLFLAHEILQARCIFDRRGVHKQFLLANSWVKKYLPVAYRESLKQSNNLTMKPLIDSNKSLFIGALYILNYSLFIIQYLYMRNRMTQEKIGLGYAFFHPKSPHLAV
jgi:hypothetical protein